MVVEVVVEVVEVIAKVVVVGCFVVVIVESHVLVFSDSAVQ